MQKQAKVAQWPNFSSLVARTFAPTRCGFALWCAAAMLAALLFVVILLTSGRVAYADEVSVSRVNIDATVSPDGSLRVVERRYIEFQDGWANVVLPLNTLQGGDLKVQGVWMGDPDDIDLGGNIISTPLSQAPLTEGWRKGTEYPSVSSYATDRARNELHIFFHAGDTQSVLTIEYTIRDAIELYRDIADLSWVYLSASESATRFEVNTTVYLPVPAGAQLVANETVRAWGHGPSSGKVIDHGNGSVVFANEVVQEGQRAEAHIVFPASWIADASQKLLREHATSRMLNTVLENEAQWVDVAGNDRVRLAMARVIVVGISAVLLLVALCLWLVFGRERLQRDAVDSVRGIHPVVLSRVWNHDRPAIQDVLVAITHLISQGKLRCTAQTVRNFLGSKRAQYFLRTSKALEKLDSQMNQGEVDVSDVRREEKSVSSRIDQATYELLFKRLAEGASELSLDGIARFAEGYPKKYLAALQEWQKQVDDCIRHEGYFDYRSFKLQIPVMLVGILWGIGGIRAVFFLDELAVGLIQALVGVLVILLGMFMPRLSSKGRALETAATAWRDELLNQGVTAPSLNDKGAASSRTDTPDIAALHDKNHIAITGSDCGEEYRPSSDDVAAQVFGLKSDAPTRYLRQTLERALANAEEGVRERHL